jgi:hypothetical protein
MEAIVEARLPLTCAAMLALSGLTVGPVVRAEDPRVVVVLGGSEHFVADLKYLCVDLADKPKEWENNVFPNVDIYLIGVEQTNPIRYDQLIGGERGRREQLMVPIDNLRNFINNNLVPAGINVVQDPLDRNLYRLGGVYNGWMRVRAGYAIFAEQRADVPADMPSPRDTHSDLLVQGRDFAARLDNRQTTAEQRTVAFASYRENSLGTTQRRPDETREAFALRRLNNEQLLETIERLFVESSQVTLRTTVDAGSALGTATFELVPAPDTPLAETIQRQAQHPSRFAGVVSPGDAVLSGRINCTLGEMSERHFAQFCSLMQAPWEQRIDKTAGLTNAQKSARKEIAELVFDTLTSSLDLGRCDGMLEITAHPGGKHTGLAAMSVKDGSPITKILELLPASDDRYRIELSVDRAGDVAIHKLTITGKYPQALQESSSRAWTATTTGCISTCSASAIGWKETRRSSSAF